MVKSELGIWKNGAVRKNKCGKLVQLLWLSYLLTCV
jgi:hypothetical protein